MSKTELNASFPDRAELSATEMSTDQSPLILVIDDDPMQQILVRASLEPFGFQCEEAEDGNVGIEKCAALTPDLVILDVMMPGQDGFSVCSEIRQNSEIHATPVLMMTALHDTQSIERAFEAGATSFLTKPINTQLLPYHLNYMLNEPLTLTLKKAPATKKAVAKKPATKKAVAKKPAAKKTAARRFCPRGNRSSIRRMLNAR